MAAAKVATLRGVIPLQTMLTFIEKTAKKNARRYKHGEGLGTLETVLPALLHLAAVGDLRTASGAHAPHRRPLLGRRAALVEDGLQQPGLPLLVDEARDLRGVTRPQIGCSGGSPFTPACSSAASRRHPPIDNSAAPQHCCIPVAASPLCRRKPAPERMRRIIIKQGVSEYGYGLAAAAPPCAQQAPEDLFEAARRKP